MDIVQALAPTIIVGLAFFGVMRAVFRADRNERAAIERMENEQNSQ